MENTKEEHREYEAENEKMNTFYTGNASKMRAAYDTYGLNLVPRVNKDVKTKYIQHQLMALRSYGLPQPQQFIPGLPPGFHRLPPPHIESDRNYLPPERRSQNMSRL
eukprot:TRINITY_DN2150_c0_g1_i3.p1 TRINITY_DN2150_c0_g1~~TRINITY_DN2150_c0_g1_i3.p1  ORF type:complete len:107 (-),score=14.63 TRINITY_DN2150_c0_g1_i3:389-709(-)